MMTLFTKRSHEDASDAGVNVPSKIQAKISKKAKNQVYLRQGNAPR
jgi:hypothetical protein